MAKRSFDAAREARYAVYGRWFELIMGGKCKATVTRLTRLLRRAYSAGRDDERARAKR